MDPNSTPMSNKHLDIGRPSITDEAASTVWANAGGAKRSSPMLPWFMKPLKAIRGSLRRFEIGLKYGYQNWKAALATPREKWHDGEPGPGHSKDESTLGFVRQFVAHGEEHWYWVTELVDLPDDAVSTKGDTLSDNVDAWVWNVLCAAEYFYENPDMFREAFSKWPVGSPFHRVDHQQQKANHEATAKVSSMEAKMTSSPTVIAPNDCVGDFEVVRIR